MQKPKKKFVFLPSAATKRIRPHFLNFGFDFHPCPLLEISIKFFISVFKIWLGFFKTFFKHLKKKIKKCIKKLL